MSDSTILTVTGDRAFLESLRKQVHDHGGAGNRMIVAATIDEACSLISAVRPRLLIVHCTKQSDSYEQLDQLLWATSLQSRRIPVLVIADRYLTDHATTLYRMGVSDYISRTHHMDNLGSIFKPYFPRLSDSKSADSASESTDGSTTSNRTRVGSSNGSRPARLV
jgi:DNA-binding NtrC family response regulator